MSAAWGGEKDVVDLLIKQSAINLDLQATGKFYTLFISSLPRYQQLYFTKIVNCRLLFNNPYPNVTECLSV